MSSDYRRPWSSEEDSAIRELVIELGVKNWSLIASELGSRYSITHRSGKQCRERWHNHLDSSIDKKPWTQEEDDLIFELHKQHGKTWSKIAESLPGRTDNSVKNRFYSTLRRNLRKYNKSRPHSQRLIGSVRNILRNPDIPELLLKEQAPARLKKGKIEERQEGMNAEIVEGNEGIRKNKELEDGNDDEKTAGMEKKVEIVAPVPSPKAPIGRTGFEKVGIEEASLLFNLSQPELNYFYFYPQAMANYKGVSQFPPFAYPIIPSVFPVMGQNSAMKIPGFPVNQSLDAKPVRFPGSQNINKLSEPHTSESYIFRSEENNNR